jgi:hypothetical protein
MGDTRLFAALLLCGLLWLSLLLYWLWLRQ